MARKSNGLFVENPGDVTHFPACLGFRLAIEMQMRFRLFQEIREKRGLAYTVYSFVSSHVDTGMFGTYAAVEPSKSIETTRLLLEQLFHLKQEKVSEAELTGAKEYIKGNLFIINPLIVGQGWSLDVFNCCIPALD